MTQSAREYLRNKIKLDTPSKNGTKRKHFESIRRQYDLMPPKLRDQEFTQQALSMLKLDREYRIPGLFKNAMEALFDIRQLKTIDEAIQFTDIHAYTTVMCINLTPYEVKLLLQLDSTYRAQYYKETEG